MSYTIYYLYDKTDDKQTPVYVGQTKKSLHARLLDHKYCAHVGVKSHIYYYMRNNGINNFNIVEIIKCDENQANAQETIAIQLLNPECNKKRVCLSSYATPALYKNAWRAQNIKNEIYKCIECGKCHGDGNRLKVHMITHKK